MAYILFQRVVLLIITVFILLIPNHRCLGATR